jgi:hypothetical protein
VAPTDQEEVTMRATVSATGQRLLGAAFTMALAGCASSPVYTYKPTDAPLRYEFKGSVSNEIETPGGVQTSGGETEATAAISIAASSDSGTVLSLTFDSFRTSAAGGPGSGESGAESAEDAAFRVAWRPTGAVDILKAPDTDLEGASSDDLAGIAVNFVTPLPPGGSVTSEGWPHRVDAPVGSGLKGSAKYDGVARLAGDTTWNGTPVQKIVSEGNWVLTATGTPTGSPTEIALEMDGTSSTTYFWDPARGLMLAAEATSKGRGEVTAMGFQMPISNVASSTIALRMPSER